MNRRLREGRKWLAEFTHRSLGAFAKVGTEILSNDVERRLDHPVGELISPAPLLDSFLDVIFKGHTWWKGVGAGEPSVSGSDRPHDPRAARFGFEAEESPDRGGLRGRKAEGQGQRFRVGRG